MRKRFTNAPRGLRIDLGRWFEMIRKIKFEDGGWCWEIETPEGQRMWVGDDFMKTLVNHPKVKEEYEKMKEKK